MNPFRGWEICPRIVYDMAMRLKYEYGNIEWLIAENGMGVEHEERFKMKRGHSGRLQNRFYFSPFARGDERDRRRRKLQRIYALGIHGQRLSDERL